MVDSNKTKDAQNARQPGTPAAGPKVSNEDDKVEGDCPLDLNSNPPYPRRSESEDTDEDTDEDQEPDKSVVPEESEVSVETNESDASVESFKLVKKKMIIIVND